MKKKFLSVFIALVLALSLCLMTAGPVVAAGNNDRGAFKGAVKADLTELRTESPVVGSVILNTTDEGILIVVIKVEDLPNLENYDVRVHVNNAYRPIFEDVLNTNAKGHGNAQINVNLLDENGDPLFTGTTIGVDVVLRPSIANQTTPCYTTNWPKDVIVPLK